MNKSEFITYAKSLEANKDIPDDAIIKFNVEYWNERDWEGPLFQPMEEWGTHSYSLCNPYTDPTEYFRDWWKCVPLKGGTFLEIPPGAKANDTSLDPTMRAFLSEYRNSWKMYTKYSFKTKEDMKCFEKSYVFKYPCKGGSDGPQT